jgi:hypothetical protein
MAELNAFHAALGCIGFNPGAQDALNNQGILPMMSLVQLQKDAIKWVCKLLRESVPNPIPMSIIQEQNLGAMRFWAKYLNHTG